MKQLKEDPVITSLIGRGRFDEARQTISNLLQKDPNDIVALYYLAMCEYLEHDLDKAENTVKSILRKNDQFVPAQELLDRISIRLADTRQPVQQVKPAKAAARDIEGGSSSGSRRGEVDATKVSSDRKRGSRPWWVVGAAVAAFFLGFRISHDPWIAAIIAFCAFKAAGYYWRSKVRREAPL